MKAKKLVILFFALLFPGLIFLFLKLFGDNEFDVPVLHQQGRIDSQPGCDFAYTTPYRIADSVMNRLRTNGTDSLYVLYFDSGNPTASERIERAFSGQPVRLIPAGEGVAVDTAFLKNCVLLMDDGVSITLVDHLNRIRGYYDGSDRDEVDRLMAEIKIILKQY